MPAPSAIRHPQTAILQTGPSSGAEPIRSTNHNPQGVTSELGEVGTVNRQDRASAAEVPAQSAIRNPQSAILQTRPSFGAEPIRSTNANRNSTSELGAGDIANRQDRSSAGEAPVQSAIRNPQSAILQTRPSSSAEADPIHERQPATGPVGAWRQRHRESPDRSSAAEVPAQSAIRNPQSAILQTTSSSGAEPIRSTNNNPQGVMSVLGEVGTANRQDRSSAGEAPAQSAIRNPQAAILPTGPSSSAEPTRSTNANPQGVAAELGEVGTANRQDRPSAGEAPVQSAIRNPQAAILPTGPSSSADPTRSTNNNPQLAPSELGAGDTANRQDRSSAVEAPAQSAIRDPQSAILPTRPSSGAEPIRSRNDNPQLAPSELGAGDTANRQDRPSVAEAPVQSAIRNPQSAILPTASPAVTEPVSSQPPSSACANDQLPGRTTTPPSLCRARRPSCRPQPRRRTNRPIRRQARIQFRSNQGRRDGRISRHRHTLPGDRFA